jgi:transcriptional repressor of dcmA and dcmR
LLSNARAIFHSKRWKGEVSGRELTMAPGRCLLGKPLRTQEIADGIELLDIGQAAAFLNVSEASLRRWTNSGRLACLRVGRRRERRFRREDLLGFMEGQSSAGPSIPDAGANRLSNLSARPLAATPGSHLCGIFSSDLGRLTLIVSFLLDGLNEGSVCYLVGPLRARTEVIRNLKKQRPTLQEDIDEGRLIHAEYHLGPRAQVKYFRALLDRKVADGARSFRIVGDLWGMRSKATQESLLQYEADYDRLIAREFPVVTLCAYDARKFTGVEILEALKGHRDTFRYPLERALA